MKEIILATNNRGKIAELQAILAPTHCISQASLGIDSVEETGLSFVENALLKARYASRMTNKPALADDSGLVVAALNGEPGIYSARYAGINASDADNIIYLLDKLKGTPDSERQAYFYCAIVMVQHADDPTPLIACGQLHGVIARYAVGEHGFGYDPVFYIPSHQCTAAQLPAHIKNTISHRAEALKQLREQLQG
jgi:XTP/dITP diphosphohydrolase